MKTSRRSFLAGSLGLTLGGCANLIKAPEGSQSSAKDSMPIGGRTPSATSALGYRLSSPIESMQEHYSAIVVGSGYGASVMAARLGEKFKDMCILERGREWHPGDFPTRPDDLPGAMKSFANPLGLIDIEAGQDIDIVCASGLGGTSLINAAIAIRPEMNVFSLPVWPKEISAAAESGELEKYYQRAESVLQPSKLNQHRFEKSKVHKMDALNEKRNWDELRLNIRPEEYGEAKPNDFGYPQSKCVQCGNCCSGCNYGAKNTLVTNYLYMAYRKGVKIFTQVEVDSIEKQKGRYILNLKIIHGLGKIERKQVSADFVFLGAGSKGSTQILMRSESNGFTFSNALGTKLSANGDVMGMSYNTNFRTNIIARTTNKLKDGLPPAGLIIATYADYRKPSLEGDVQSQFLLLDGVVPSAFAGVVSKALGAYGWLNREKLYGHLPKALREEKLERIRADESSFEAPEDGALNHSMLYFACGHDSSGGRFVFNRQSGLFDYQWKDVLKEPTFARIQGVMKKFATHNGGNFILNPRSTIFGGNIQATHPLGGCPMSDDPKKGVVNHLGRVYDSGGGFHDNLYVVDAATIPHSLSATPLLTITAFAERIADSILKSETNPA